MILPPSIARELLPVLRQSVAGRYGVALGGSHAKGRGDALSDLDIYIFAADFLSAPQRTDLFRRELTGATEISSWGSTEPGVEGGTDFTSREQRVECWFREIGQVEAAIAAARRGEFRREYRVWTVMGFFSHTVLADLRTMRILEDPDGLLAHWQSEVSTYPEPLRKAVVDRFLREARFWPGNPHYQSAIERQDLIYTSGIVQQVIHALIQVVFALNREYFPGEKNVRHALSDLPLRPKRFGERIEVLVSAAAASTERLPDQRHQLAELVAEVEALVTSAATSAG